jgi:3',5'-cyclic AMP phosphodiesterase CpdA
VRTDRWALHPDPPGGAGDGYRRLHHGRGEPHVPRDELGFAPRPGEWLSPLLTLIHLSDAHIRDAQSPAGAGLPGREADSGCPIRDRVGGLGAPRPQDLLAAHVLEATVQAANAVHAGPLGGGPADLAIVTGDSIDNGQANELGWYLRVLDGGVLVAGSGDRGRPEGAEDAGRRDPHSRHPGDPADDPSQARYGFPAAPDLLAAARLPFRATGLQTPWLGVHGNHDRRMDDSAPAAVAADPSGRIVTRAQFLAAHAGPMARPPGHGFRPGPTGSIAYYRHDAGEATVLVLDTVNPAGGGQGSLDEAQLAWLDDELAAADADRRVALLASHHPLDCLSNDRAREDGRPVLRDEVSALLDRRRCVAAWLAGHTHQSRITARSTRGSAYWEIVAPSLIDWPQQARVIELLRRRDGSLALATTMLDHTGSAPWGGATDSIAELAGLSRELAANDGPWRDAPLRTHPRAGSAADRNAVLALPLSP